MSRHEKRIRLPDVIEDLVAAALTRAELSPFSGEKDIKGTERVASAVNAVYEAFKPCKKCKGKGTHVFNKRNPDAGDIVCSKCGGSGFPLLYRFYTSLKEA